MDENEFDPDPTDEYGVDSGASTSRTQTLDDAGTTRPSKWPATARPARYSLANLVGGNIDVSPLIAMAIGALLAFFAYVLLADLAETEFASFLRRYTNMFTGGAAYIQFGILWLFMSGVVILIVKLLRYFEQVRVFGLNLIPAYLTRITATEAARMLETIPRRVKFYSTKVLARRIVEVLEHYVAGGMAESAAEVARDRGRLDAEALKTSYSFLHVLIWGIPILGVIGTVHGISHAIDVFAGFDLATTDLAVHVRIARFATRMSTAFDTTLIALIATLILMFLTSPMHKAEQELHNDTDHVVLSRLVSKLDRSGAGDGRNERDTR